MPIALSGALRSCAVAWSSAVNGRVSEPRGIYVILEPLLVEIVETALIHYQSDATASFPSRIDGAGDVPKTGSPCGDRNRNADVLPDYGECMLSS